MAIRYVQHSDIDPNKWDDCIRNSLAPKAYAFSRILNHLCQWDALILGDYQAVWPIPLKKKWGIPYGYQPSFLQQLGLFSPDAKQYEQWELWLPALKGKVLLADMQLNHRMTVHSFSQSLSYKQRCNYVLSLKPSHEEIKNSYDSRHRSRLNKIARENTLTAVVNETTAETAVDFFSQHQGALDQRLTKLEYDGIKSCMTESADLFEIYAAHANDELCGVAIFLKDDRRHYLIMSSPNELGRKLNSQLFLIDQLIANEAGKSDRILDFEGSDYPQVGHFYRKFGGHNEGYSQIRYYAQPFMRFLKPTV